MDKNRILCLFHSPHGPWGLRHRASILPEKNAYRILLEIMADSLEKKRLSQELSRILIEYARAGNIELSYKILKRELEKSRA